MIIATHEMSFAREVADKVCFLDAGVIREQGPPAEIFSSPREPRTREFLSARARGRPAVRRFRGASKAPLAVAGILAAPLFFVALMAFSLKFDKPEGASPELADPTSGTVWKIYLVTFGVVGALVLVGALSILVRSRLARIIPAVAGIVITIVLLLPLGTWARRIPTVIRSGSTTSRRSSPQDIWLRGEWEHNAKVTAQQIGLAAIGIAVAAIVISIALEIRRRRGIECPGCPAAARGDGHGGAATPRGSRRKNR